MADRTWGNRSTRRGSLRRFARRLVMAIVLLCVATGAAGWLMARAEPEYWREVDRNDPAVVQRAEAFEQELERELGRIRPQETSWELTLEQEELREWVATRMPEWLKDKGVQQDLPPWLDQPMVVFEDDKLVVAGRVSFKGCSQIISVQLEPVTGPGGEVELRLAGAKAGRLPLPSGALLDKLVAHYGSVDAAQAAAIRKVKKDLEHMPLPVVDLSDGRKVEITNIHLRSGVVVLECRTVNNNRSRAISPRETT